ncbi:HisA/HisF-related TIM barrel protein [Pseudomonas protegens]|uniref:HisA/HisF-related TIM barrel protein n=1 Tax=Pseudomonas protegens TaxID=380021 RepID=UPI003D09D7E0
MTCTLLTSAQPSVATKPSLATIEHYVKAGVSYVIIGTKAVKEPEFVAEACRAFPGKVIVGLDAKDGFVATDGWAAVKGTLQPCIMPSLAMSV